MKLPRLLSTASLSNVMFAVGLFLAYQLHNYVMRELVYIASVIVFLGGICVLRANARVGILSNPELQIFTHKTKQFITLVLWQVGLLFCTVCYFSFIENQTQVHPRFVEVASGQFVKTLQVNFYGLGILPWAIFSIVGVGIAYVSVYLKQKPNPARILIMNAKKNKSKLFLHNAVMTIFNLCAIFPAVVFSGFVLVWLGEWINHCFGWESFFSVPERTLLICGLILILLRKSNIKLIEWMQSHRVSVGAVLFAYMTVFLFFLLWLHVSAEFLSESMKKVAPVFELQRSKNNQLIEASLDNRMFVFVFGWWLMWMPWMSSVIARASLGHTLLRATIQSLLVPVLVFGVLLPRLTKPMWQQAHEWLQQPNVQLVCVMCALFFLWKIWANVRTMGDLHRGAMVSLRSGSKQCMDKWMAMLLMAFSCYVVGSFSMGWVMTQVLVNAGIIVTFLVSGFFVVAWGIELSRSSAAVKYKATEAS